MLNVDLFVSFQLKIMITDYRSEGNMTPNATRLTQKTFLLRSLFLWGKNRILQVKKNKTFGVLYAV